MNVRISNMDMQSILFVLNGFFPFKGAEAFIYGSRVELDKKGGDIDLLIVLLDKNEVVNELQTILSFETAVKNKIGDQKIDTHIISRSELEKGDKSFINVIKKRMVKIWEFHDE